MKHFKTTWILHSGHKGIILEVLGGLAARIKTLSGLSKWMECFLLTREESAAAAAAAAKLLQSCLTLCDPIDGIAFPSPVHESEK